MSTTNVVNPTTPKVGKHGSVPKTRRAFASANLTFRLTPTVRLGNSGLKVSRIILGSSSRVQVNLRLTGHLPVKYVARMHELWLHEMARMDVG